MIGIGTTAIRFLPTYASVGRVWASCSCSWPCALCKALARALNAGGAVILLVEYAPARHRGFWGGFAPLGVSIGNLLAAGALALVTMLPQDALMSWGWRLPFLASAVLILLGLYVRLRVMETPVFREAVAGRHKIERNPAMAAPRLHPRKFPRPVRGAHGRKTGLDICSRHSDLSYVVTTLGVPRGDALSALMLAFVIELFAILGFSALSDRIGRRPVYMFGALSGIALAFPFFWLVGTREWIWIAVAFVLARAVVTAAQARPAGGLFRIFFPPPAALRGLCPRPRIGLPALGRTGSLRRGRSGDGGLEARFGRSRLRDRTVRDDGLSQSAPDPETYTDDITVDNSVSEPAAAPIVARA